MDKNNKPPDSTSDRIKALLASLDMKPLHLANKAGIQNETIYRCLNGIREWNLNHLRKIAPVLGVGLADLVQEPVMVAQAGAIKAGHGPSQSEILRSSTDPQKHPFRQKGDAKTLAKLYELTVEDQSMEPELSPGQSSQRSGKLRTPSRMATSWFFGARMAEPLSAGYLSAAMTTSSCGALPKGCLTKSCR